MNRPVRTTTPDGEEIVILAAAEYERLVRMAEDVGDVSHAIKALADFKAGNVEALDEAEMAVLLGAASPLAFWRKRRGMTQAALAKTVGISQAYFAQIERGARGGDAGLYRRFAQSLKVATDDLIPFDGDSKSRIAQRRRRKRADAT